MQFNGNADNQDIISDITFLLSGIDTNEYTLRDRTRNVNERYRQVLSMIFESYGGWLFMDDNVSGTTGSGDVPFADQNISANQAYYALPAGTITVIGVEIKYFAATTWIQMTPLSYEEFLRQGGDAAFPTAATPWAYLLQGDVIRLLPMPNFSQNASLRVFFDQDVATFASTDTTKVPGFASPFHRMLSVGAALDFANARGLPKVALLQNLWNDYEKRLREFYSSRYKSRYPMRIDPGEDLMDQFS